MDERIAARRDELRRQQQRRRRFRLLVVALVLCVVAGVVGIDRGGVVDIEHVDVVGLERATRGEVVDAMAMPEGATLLTVRTRQLERRVEDLPLVRDATVRRTAHDRLTVSVTERRAALEVTGRGRTVLVDREGIVIDDGALGNLPVVELETRPPASGGTVSDDAALGNAFTVWRGLSGPLRAEVRVYEASGEEELHLELDRGVRVRFGRAERIDEKIRAIGAVLADLGDTEVDHIDVRAPAAPVVVVP